MLGGAATTPIRPEPLASFRNPCGRRGCGHIFEYEGTNPLDGISELVNAHRPYCPGRRVRGTHALGDRPSQTVPQIREQFRDMDEDLSDDDDEEGDDDDEGSHAGPSHSRSSPPRQPSPRGTPSTDASVARSGKKSARTEAERRATLEDDQWTLSVTAHDVVCRGCRRTIKLDRRSRYYPGLWEKHRDRCENVNKLRNFLDAASAGSPEAQRMYEEALAAPSAAYYGVTPLDLTRRPYYRERPQ
ncbi:hypothetical protein B0H10DRAFT_196646 [Mycena sp. CBHHK59/15]|nr:hypothetical protein B0H10DRAFT_196646 [Mycena sp. CBHHK59/15]